MKTAVAAVALAALGQVAQAHCEYMYALHADMN
jgi:hypothetical protein